MGDAGKVACLYSKIIYDIVADIVYDFMQIGKVLASQNMDDSSTFTRSEQILLDHQRLNRMNARDLKDLIQHMF